MIPTLLQQVEAAAAADAAARRAAFAARYAANAHRDIGAPSARNAHKARCDHGILAALGAHPGLSAAALSVAAPGLGLSARSWANILARMERAAWVGRLPPRPGRPIGPGEPLRYAITDGGRAMLAQLAARVTTPSLQEHTS